jgi:Mg-chelatase subunit ChlD
MVEFSDSAQVVFNLNDHTDNKSLIHAVLTAPYLGGLTNLNYGLELARDEVFAKQARSGTRVEKAIIIITDGVDNVGESMTLTTARELKDLDVTIFAVGVTSAIDVPRLRDQIASQPRYYFNVTQYSELITILESLASELCQPVLYAQSKFSVHVLCVN